jgi:four helix bundle protein
MVEKSDFVLCKQLLRSGTSIGANVKEAIRAQSKADFIARMNISLKEASESEYWIELLSETEYIKKEQSESLLYDCRELIKILTRIVKNSIRNSNVNVAD